MRFAAVFLVLLASAVTMIAPTRHWRHRHGTPHSRTGFWRWVIGLPTKEATWAVSTVY
jgi:hypothetical protein